MKVGSCGRLFLSSIDKQNLSLYLMLSSLKPGLIAFEWHRIAPNLTFLLIVDLLTFNAHARDRTVFRRDKGIRRTCSRSIWILFRPQFFILLWDTSVRSLLELLFARFQIRWTVRIDVENNDATYLVVYFFSLTFTLLSNKAIYTASRSALVKFLHLLTCISFSSPEKSLLCKYNIQEKSTNSVTSKIYKQW